MKKLIGTFKSIELEEIDKRIIKGIFYRKNRDFNEELLKNRETLYSRLMRKQTLEMINAQPVPIGILQLLNIEQ